MKHQLLLSIYCLFSTLLFAQIPEKKVLLQTHNGEFNNVLGADLDNNGLQDFIAIEGYITWFEGTGDSTWGNSHTIAEDGLLNIIDCNTIDVDNDGFMDLFYTTGYYLMNFGWLKNPGIIDAPWINNEISGSYSYFIGLFDVDGDSDKDLVYENEETILKWKENVDNEFIIVHYTVDGLPALVSSNVYDYDNDGDMDWTGYFNDCCVKYYKNNSDGTFTVSSISTDEYEENIYTTDVNGDGYADVLIEYYSTIDLAIFDPVTNTFGTAGLWDIFTFESLQFKDMDDDGDNDWVLFIQDGSNMEIRWIEYTGAEMSLDDAVTLITELPAASPYISLIDINNDNKPDVWVADGIGVDVYLNELPAGTFGNAFDPENTLIRMDISRVFDIDNDGDNDLMVANHNGKLAWFKYDIATDSFYGVHFLPNFEASPYPTLMREFDLDNDGDQDLITTFRSSMGAEQIAYYCLNDGAGNFSIHEFDDLAFNNIWMTDADEDGDEDLLVMQFSWGNYLHLYLNTGDTSSMFNYAEQLTTTGYWMSLDMIDIDNDGDEDMIGNQSYSTQIQKFTNISGGTFSAPVLFYNTACSNIASIYTDDFDNDTDFDFLYTCQTTGATTLGTNNAGSFTYSAAGTFITDEFSGPSSTETRDINGDNIPDLINSKYTGSTTIKLSTGPGTFDPDYEIIYSAFGQFGQFDNNGIIDFVGATDFEYYVQYDAIFASPSFTITEATATILQENGASDGVTISFLEIPQVELLIDIFPSGSIDAGAGEGIPVTITFFPDSSALIPQTITWLVPDDLIVEDIVINAIQIVNDPETWGLYEGMLDETFSYTIIDNDAGLFLNSEEITLIEGVTFATLSGHVNVIPAAETVLNIIPGSLINAGEGTGEIKSITIAEGIDGIESFLFTLSVDNDFIHELNVLEEVNFEFITADPVLNVLIAEPLLVNINDNDYVSISTAFPGVTITEEIEPFTIGFNLSSAPEYDVIIHATPDAQFDLGGGAGVAVSITFTADGLLPVYQNFNGTGVEDGVFEGIHSGSITFSIETADPFYAALTIDELFVNLVDNPAIEGVNVVFLNTDIFTEGTTDIPVSLSLFSIPDEPVIIYVTPDSQLDLGAGAGNPIYYIFEATDAALVSQMVYITIFDDLLIEGEHTGTITFSSESADIVYQDLTIPDITINISDNDNEVAVNESENYLHTIYPTINSGIFTVQSESGSDEKNIYVINMQGQIIFQETMWNTITVDISSNPAGKYFVVLNDHKTMYTQTIEIVK